MAVGYAGQQMKPWLKLLSACFTSWLFLVALGMALGDFKILGSQDSSVGIVWPLVLAFLACYGLSWANTKSLGWSFIGALGGILIGLPLSYLVLVPFGYWLAGQLFPLSNLGLSGSLGGSWFLLGIVVMVEILTDQLHINKRWLMLLISIVVVMIPIYGIELLVARSGISNDRSVFMLELYTPLIWGCIVGIVNIQTVAENNREQGGKNGYIK
jgi:hypothetical protein